MCSYLLAKPDDTRPVICFEHGLVDIGKWRNLVTGGFSGRVNVQREQLRMVPMNYFGQASGGYFATAGQTGCTVILVIQETGHVGRWAYFSHVNSGMIEQGMQHACDAVSQLPNRDSIIFVMMGGPGGKSIYIDLLRQVRLQGARWRFLVLLRPDTNMEESVLSIADCSLAFTQAPFLSGWEDERRQLPGFHPEHVPTEPPKPVPVITGHRALDRKFRSSTSRVEFWIDLSIECNVPPRGMPDDREHEEGVQWMMDRQNLLALMGALAKQEDYDGLDVGVATARLLSHLQRLPLR